MIALDTNVLAHFYVEDRDLVQSALGQMRQGLDFADALHLAASHRCSEMVTFDARRFAKRSNRLGLKPRCSVPLRQAGASIHRITSSAFLMSSLPESAVAGTRKPNAKAAMRNVSISSQEAHKPSSSGALRPPSPKSGHTPTQSPRESDRPDLDVRVKFRDCEQQLQSSASLPVQVSC